MSDAPDSTRENLEVVERFLAAFDRRWPEEDELAELVGPDIHFTERPNLVNPGGSERDRAAMRAGLEAGRRLLAWQSYEVRDHVASGDTVVTRMRWSGELAADAGPWPAGTRMSAWCVAHYRLAAGRIVRIEQHDCYEQPSLRRCEARTVHERSQETRVVVLGAGFGDLELSTLLSEAGGGFDVTLIAKNEAGVFAEGAARVVARSLIAELQGGERPGPYAGRGSCYIEFGHGRAPGRSTRRPPPWSPRRSTSAPAAGRAGSRADRGGEREVNGDTLDTGQRGRGVF